MIQDERAGDTRHDSIDFDAHSPSSYFYELIRQREEENNITPGDGLSQGMYTIREAPYQGNDTIDEVPLEAVSKTGSTEPLDILTADGAAK